jgi:hypothetical protein
MLAVVNEIQSNGTHRPEKERPPLRNPVQQCEPVVGFDFFAAGREATASRERLPNVVAEVRLGSVGPTGGVCSCPGIGSLPPASGSLIGAAAAVGGAGAAVVGLDRREGRATMIPALQQ